MNRNFQIQVDWEQLDDGSPEERSCFAALGIRAHGTWMTEGRDDLANRLRQAPHLSAYHLAEWFAWNWWRLRWEPRASSADWDLAHRMVSVGQGYIWPDLTIFSDGERTALVAKAGRDQPQAPFRYISETAAVLPSLDFEAEIDQFCVQVIERLDAAGIRDSNFNTIWNELTLERADPQMARVRKLEALLGLQPDQLGVETLNAFLASEGEYGEGAVNELAADQGCASAGGGVLPGDLVAQTRRFGYEFAPRDMVDLPSAAGVMQALSHTPAWRAGSTLAKQLRSQQKLVDDAAVSDHLLAEMAAVEARALEGTPADDSRISCLLAEPGSPGRIMLRSKWKTGRRFELARLLGDHLMGHPGTLHPATRAFTYRQKMQRAFAAELLSPFVAVDALLQGDYSPEAQTEVANHFNVSELTVRTQLVNHHRLDRDQLDSEPDLSLVAA